MLALDEHAAHPSDALDVDFEVLPAPRDALDAEFAALKRVDGMRVLGVPVGTDAFIAADLQLKRNELDGILTNLELLEDPQVAFYLLLRSGSSCRVTHLARGLAVEHSRDFLAWFDERVIRALTNILGREALLARPIRQARLTLGLGGLGLRAALRARRRVAHLRALMQREEHYEAPRSPYRRCAHL